MAGNTWVNQVRQQSDGSSSRTDRELTDRTSYLKRRLDAAEFGQAVFAHDQTLDPDVLENQPVYWNDETQRFELALAGAENDEVSGSIVPTAASDCLGVVSFKELPDKGSVMLFGYGPFDPTNAIGANAPAGRYYLSTSEPGKLAKQRPGVSVPVLFYDGNGKAFVQPAIRDFAEDHIHFSFELVCRPAGHSDQPELGQKHTIKAIDVTAPGWLPASVFGEQAPRRAAFGYNLAAHPALQRVWPPIPVTAVSVVWDKGNSHTGGTIVPLGADGLIVVDRFGIWWMSDEYGDVPWPTATSTSKSSYPEESYTSSDTSPESPRFEKMGLTLSFVRMAFATDKTVVTSLQPDTDSPIRFVDCDGKEAKTGDLKARFVSDFLVDDNDTDGSLAIKSLTGNKFQRGYMVEGILSGNDNLTIAGTRSKAIRGKTYWQGLLELSVNLDPAARDLPVQLVELNDAKERHYEDLLYIGLGAGIDSSIRAKIKVPGAGLPASPKCKLRIQVLGRGDGTLPDLAVTYRRVVRPTGAAVALPLTDTTLTFSSSQAILTDQYVEVESQAFDVTAGDTVMFTIARDSSDGYTGEVGLLDVVGILFAGG
jgi:hypothetical protein